MVASELLRGEAPFVADTSAWWRAAALPRELGDLLDAAILSDRMWITPIVRMEVLYSARSSAEYVAIEGELDALRILRNDRAVADAAMAALGELAERGDGYHRVPITDALIAATRTSTSSPRFSRLSAWSFRWADRSTQVSPRLWRFWPYGQYEVATSRR